RPISSQSWASEESCAARPRSVASESVGATGGACDRVTSTNALQRDIAMLLRRIPISLGGKGGERVDQSRPGVTRIDDVVHVAARGRDIRVGELLAILGLARLGRVLLIRSEERRVGTQD